MQGHHINLRIHDDAKGKREMAGFVLADSALHFPTSFLVAVLHNIVGTVWSPVTRERKEVSLFEYMDSAWHLKASLVMSGAPALGKTPLLYALCAELARRYVSGSDPWFLVAGCPEGFKEAIAASLLKPGVPVLMEDFQPSMEVGDRQSLEEYYVNLFGVRQSTS